MLIPRLSLRWILGSTTALAVFFMALRQAANGTDWAIALVILVALATGIFLLYGVTFLVAYGANNILKSVSPEKTAASPFVVEGQYPPQQIPRNPIRDQE